MIINEIDQFVKGCNILIIQTPTRLITRCDIAKLKNLPAKYQKLTVKDISFLESNPKIAVALVDEFL